MKQSSISFRHFHLLSILENYQSATMPLDCFLRRYFKEHRAIGAKDRAYICQSIYGMVRWLGLLDHFSKANWQERLELWQRFDPLSYLDDESIPLHQRLSFPKAVFEKISSYYGVEICKKICLASKKPAPNTIRINRLKTSRELFFEASKDKYSLEISPHSPDALYFRKKENYFSLEEFKKGLFEVQDEGSQIVASLIEAKKGNKVLDYCCGSGGKTLAFAAQMEGKGQIYLHDIREAALLQCKKRLKRAGIQNAQILHVDTKQLQRLKKKMDWVLADVPCSGSGTWRRNPDMLWKFNEKSLQELVGKQRMIFEKALSFCRKGGKIVYATCSIFEEENEAMIEHFLRTYPVKVQGRQIKILPGQNDMDGFFAVTMIKTS